MDDRIALAPGSKLYLGCTDYRIESLLGKGGNALAYQATYADAVQPAQSHYVLIKELFPWRSEGGIFRDGTGSISCLPEAEDFFSIHQKSFLRGNQVHLEMQGARADKVPVNLNTFRANKTLYTIMGSSGGRTLQDVFSQKEPISLKTLAYWMQNLLYSLRAFHERGLLHLDISPDNILLQPLDQGRSEISRDLLLIDYNSVWRQAELAGHEKLFLSLKGTYSAPELRLRELDSVGPTTDLYSVCVVFLTGLLGWAPQGMIRRLPPVGNAPLLQGVSKTVFHQVLTILRNGLKAPPNQRYMSADAVIQDFSELIQRIDGNGVTHAALWEASAARFQVETKRISARTDIKEIAASKVETLEQLEKSGHCVLTGESGSGKTSILLSLCYRGTIEYSPSKPIPVYIPLYAYDGRENYLLRSILELLSFSSEESWNDAYHALARLLKTPVNGVPSICLLLDGVDEAVGDLHSLMTEIRTLVRSGGVQIVAAARQMPPDLNFPERRMPPLTTEEINAYLEKNQMPRPIKVETLDILSTPVFLSMYRSICQRNGTATDAIDEDGLFVSYFEALVSSHRETYGVESGFQAEFAVYVLLPFLAAQMNNSSRLSPDDTYRCVEACFSMLGKRRFLRIFPQYMGRSGILRGGSSDVEAWFALMVRDILERHLSLLWQDDQGDYHLLHQSFQRHLANMWHPVGKMLIRSKVRIYLPAFLTIFICICLGISWGVKSHLGSALYPQTAQEQQIAVTLVNQLALSCGLADFQYQVQADILEAVDDELLRGSEDAWRRWQIIKERKIAYSESLDISSTLEEELLSELADAPVPLEAVEKLFVLPTQLRRELPEWISALEVCLAPDSRYPERDRRQAVALLEQLLESESAETFLLIGKVVSALEQGTSAPLLDYLSHTVSWRQQLRQADWTGTDYDLGLTACRDEQKELRTDLAALGLLPYRED